MNPRVFLFFLALLGSGAVLARADPTDDAIVAAMKLSTVTSYSWSTTTKQNTRSLEIHGKTSAEGYSLLTFVGFSAGVVSTVNSSSGGGINTVFLGDNKYVVESNGNWVTPSNASATTDPADSGKKSAAGAGGASGMRGGRNRGGSSGGGATGQRRRSGSGNDQDSTPSTRSPTIPAGLNLPHEELAIVAANYTDMHFEDGVVSGKLTEFGAELLMLPPGSTQTPPDNAAGTFRLWITNGAVTKYELKLTADTAPIGMGIKGNFAETITVELTDVDATKVNVPSAAKKKLGA